VLALAPGVDPIIGALGALAGEVPDVLPPAVRDSPILSAAIASLIGTDAGKRVLPTWAAVAPAGWGASLAAALIDAVRTDRCPPWSAAALIGPTSDTAALLTMFEGIARAVRRWSLTTPNDPTAWMDALAPAERDRLLSTLRTHADAATRCLPWLPRPLAADIAEAISNMWEIRNALDAYTAASPVARALHADILAALIRRAGWDHLADLTRLAAASRMDAAWTAVAHLLRDAPNDAVRVVAAAPWDALHADVQATILSATDNDSTSICAAIAFARGVRGDAPPITQATVRAFFAAVTPTVWDTLTEGTQRAWRDALSILDAHLAVRSLGPDPMFLAGATLDDDLIAAVHRHVRDAHAMRLTLFPIAVRYLPIADVPAIVAALPSPPDPVAFVQIVGRHRDMPLALRDWITAHPTPQALAGAITALRAASQSAASAARSAALAAAFAGWSSEEATAFLAALPDNTRAMLHPNADALASALAHPNQQDVFRQALAALAALPPSAALPAFHALDALAAASNLVQRRQAGEELARALRNHGNGFLALVDALADVPRTAILPQPRSAPRAVAVRAIAAADPLAAYRLAHALRKGKSDAVLNALMDAPFDTLTRIWRLLPETLQHAVLGDLDALLRDVAAPGRVDDLAQALQDWGADAPLPLLALRMLIGDSEERRAWGISALARRPDVAAALLPLMHADARMLLEHDVRIAIAGADLPPSRPSTPARRRRR
jgi:uncharacterized membrane protein YeaQ/YmgE (transglycosylase-associated protein family)